MMSENEQESEKHETPADIVAEYRNDADAMDRGKLYQPTTEYVRRLLDRIEAAWKREKAEVEANALAVGGVVEAERMSTTEKSSAVGNAAAMREALETIHDKVNSLDEECGVDPVEVRDLARAALSAPPRQCDVGTFEEQRKRFKAFCRDRQYGLCDGCPVVRSGFCTLQWAQMPYEKGGAK